MNYIKNIREKVGHECIFLNFSSAIIVNRKGEILIQKRGDKKLFGFPGGTMELGESAEETVIREVKEETGLDIKVKRLIGVYTKYFDTYPNGDKAQPIVIFFECMKIGGKIKVDNKETLELLFVSPNKVPKLFNKQHNDVLKDYINNKHNVYR